jgi:hypothetical protein
MTYSLGSIRTFVRRSVIPLKIIYMSPNLMGALKCCYRIRRKLFSKPDPIIQALHFKQYDIIMFILFILITI